MEIPAIVTVDAALAADELAAAATTLEVLEADVAATLAAFTAMSCFIASTLPMFKGNISEQKIIYIYTMTY